MRLSRRLTHVAACVAAILLAVPAQALPCLDSDCDLNNDPACAVECAECDCVACLSAAPGCEPREQIPHPPEQPDGPCECPPGCPAPCGTGKLPCLPTGISTPPASPMPSAPAAEPAQRVHALAASDDVFRPPRG